MKWKEIAFLMKAAAKENNRRVKMCPIFKGKQIICFGWIVK
jgi:hypothetical protein